MPANQPIRIDQERAVQRQLFEVVVHAIVFERLQFGIGHQGNRHFLVAQVLERRFQTVERVAANSHERDAQFLKLRVLRCEGMQLLDAVQAAKAQVENGHHRPTLELLERTRLAVRTFERPSGRGRRPPAERTQRVERRTLPDVAGRHRFDTPVGGQFKRCGDRFESLEDGGNQVQRRRLLAQLLEHFLGFILLPGPHQQVGLTSERLYFVSMRFDVAFRRLERPVHVT